MKQDKKLASTFRNMTVVLLAVTFISSAALSSVYTLTKEPIAAAQQKTKMKAIDEVVVTGYENNPIDEMYTITADKGFVLECFPAKKGGEVTSVAIKTLSPMGFSGNIELMVGLLPNGKINKISVIAQKETPGLGTKIDEVFFKSQFEDKDPKEYKLAVKKDGGNVDAITAATISSRAFADAVARAYTYYMQGNKND